jgi:hypothetical protein
MVAVDTRKNRHEYDGAEKDIIIFYLTTTAGVVVALL